MGNRFKKVNVFIGATLVVIGVSAFARPAAAIGFRTWEQQGSFTGSASDVDFYGDKVYVAGYKDAGGGVFYGRLEIRDDPNGTIVLAASNSADSRNLADSSLKKIVVAAKDTADQVATFVENFIDKVGTAIGKVALTFSPPSIERAEAAPQSCAGGEVMVNVAPSNVRTLTINSNSAPQSLAWTIDVGISSGHTCDYFEYTFEQSGGQDLSVSDASFSPVSGPSNTTFTISDINNSNQPGTYDIKINVAAYNNTFKTEKILGSATLTINVVSTESASLSLPTTSFTLNRGSVATVPFQISGSFSGAAQVYSQALPAVPIDAGHVTIDPGANTSGNLTVNVPANAQPGTYTVSVWALWSPSARETNRVNITLNVLAADRVIERSGIKLTSVRVLDNGDAIVGGYRAASPYGWYLARYSSAGTVLWEKTGAGGGLPDTGFLNRLKVYSGYVWAAGDDGTNWRLVEVVAADGSVGRTIANGFGGGAASVKGTIYDVGCYDSRTFGCYVSGYQDVSGTFTLRVEGLFDNVWTKTSPSASRGMSLVVDYAAGNLYVGGRGNLHGWLEKRSLVNGNLVSAFGTNGVAEVSDAWGFYGLAGDEANIYAVGSPNVYDLASYDKTKGSLVWEQGDKSGVTAYTYQVSANPSAPTKIYLAGCFWNGSNCNWYIQKLKTRIEAGDSVRTVHIADLKNSIERVRSAFNLTTSWEPSLVASPNTQVRASQISELREKITNLTGGGCPSPSWTDDPLVGNLPIRTVHLNEISDIVDKAISSCIRRAFVTAETYNGNLGGVSGADAKCQAAADGAGLGGTWKSWIAISDDSSSAPATRFSKKYGYKRLDGQWIARSWSDLADGTLEAPVTIDQNGGNPVARDKGDYWVWTNTMTDGTALSAGGNGGDKIFEGKSCSRWTTNNDLTKGKVGLMDRTDWTWLIQSGWERQKSWSGWGNSSCSSLSHIYCFEDDPIQEKFVYQSAVTTKPAGSKQLACDLDSESFDIHRVFVDFPTSYDYAFQVNCPSYYDPPPPLSKYTDGEIGWELSRTCPSGYYGYYTGLFGFGSFECSTQLGQKAEPILIYRTYRFVK